MHGTLAEMTRNDFNVLHVHGPCFNAPLWHSPFFANFTSHWIQNIKFNQGWSKSMTVFCTQYFSCTVILKQRRDSPRLNLLLSYLIGSKKEGTPQVKVTRSPVSQGTKLLTLHPAILQDCRQRGHPMVEGWKSRNLDCKNPGMWQNGNLD